MIEKITGRVAYAVISFGGFLGLGEEEHTIPWNKLNYDTGLGGYRTDVTEEQLRGAPTFSAIASMTGRTESASGNCMITGKHRHTGVLSPNYFPAQN